MMERYFFIILFLPLGISYFFSGDQINSSYRSKVDPYNYKSFVAKEDKCTDCHSDLMSKPNAHAAADDCSSCHQQKIEEHKNTTQKGLNLVDKLPDLCYTCHDEIKKKFETPSLTHKAVNDAKGCVVCHSPHSSPEKKMLVMKERDMCLSCHNKEMVTKTGLIANMQLLLKTSKMEHAPVTDGCVACHNPHGSENTRLLNKMFPADQYVSAKKENFALCFDCHESGLLEDAKTTSTTSFRNGDKNLHFVHINGDKGRACTICHNVHASVNSHLIVSKVKFGTWDFKMNYTSDEKGGSCLPACHGEKKYYR